MIHASKKPYRLGATLLEVVMVLMITTSLTSGAIAFYSQYMDGQARASAAGQMRQVSEAAHEFVQERYSRLLAQVSPSGQLEITDDIEVFNRPLRDFQNPYQQTYRAFVRAIPGPEPALEMLVITDGGETLSSNDASAVVRLLGMAGGYTMDATNDVTNPSGSLDLNLSTDYGLDVGKGKLVLAVPLTHAEGNDADMLFRNAIAGRPNLNRMETDLDLGQHSMTDVGRYEGDRLEVGDGLNVPPLRAGEPGFNPAGTRIRTDIDQAQVGQANTHYLRTGPNAGAADTVTGALTAHGDGRIDGRTESRTIYTYGSDIDQRQTSGRSGGSLSTNNIDVSGVMQIAPYVPTVPGEPGGRFIQPVVTEGAACSNPGALGRTLSSPTVFMLCKRDTTGAYRWRSVLEAGGIAEHGVYDGHNVNLSAIEFTARVNAFSNVGRQVEDIPGRWGACFIGSARTSKEGTMWSSPNPPGPGWDLGHMPPPGGARDKFYYSGFANYVNPLHPYKQNRYYTGYQGAMTDFLPEADSHCALLFHGDDTWQIEMVVPGYSTVEHWCHATCVR